MKKFVFLFFILIISNSVLKAAQNETLEFTAKVETEWMMEMLIVDDTLLNPAVPNSGLVVKPGTLSPNYRDDSLNYKLTAPYKFVNTIARIIVRKNNQATFDSININGVRVILSDNGSSNPRADSLDVNVKVGDTVCKIEVKGKKTGDIPYTTTYTIKIHRQSNDNSLKSLTLQQIGSSTNNLPYTPNFNKDSLTYITDTVLSDIQNIKIDAPASHDSAKVLGVGTHPITFGWNTIPITVKAEDSIYVQTYYVKVYRKSNDTTLKNITVSSGYLSPTFSSQTSNYQLILNSRPDEITINGILSDSLAKIEGNITFPLELGDTTLTLKITAEDSRFTKEYHVKISLHYDTIELNRFKSFLEQPSSGEGTNADVLGIDLTNFDPETWSSITGVTFGVSANWIKIEKLVWDKKTLAGEIDFSGFEILHTLLCEEVPFTKMNLSNCKRLFEVFAYKNELTTFNVLGCDDLSKIEISNNKVQDLNLSGLAKLKEVNCQKNGMNSLNLSECIALQYLSCYTNNLETLNLTGLLSLEKLWCYENKITSLDCNAQMVLTELNCSTNDMEKLLVGNFSINELECIDNKLKFSTLPFVFPSEYLYSPQKDTVFNNMTTSGTVDLSSEYIVYGFETIYQWYNSDGTPINDGIINNAGIFSFDEGFAGKGIYCLMTNHLYPSLEWKARIYFYNYTGVNSLDKKTEFVVKLYPNPAKDYVNIEVTNYTGSFTIGIFDIKGKQIKLENSFCNNSETVKIQLDKMPSGVYIVSLTGKNISTTKQLIVK